MADIEKTAATTPTPQYTSETTAELNKIEPSSSSSDEHDRELTKSSSREKEHAVHEATLQHEIAEDNLEVSSLEPFLLLPLLLLTRLPFGSRMGTSLSIFVQLG